MTWDKARQTNPKYRTAEHRHERARLKAQMLHDGYLICQQTDLDGNVGAGCIMDSRVITPGQAWCAGHDNSGTVYIGPVHRPCNDRDAAVRGNLNRRGVGKPSGWTL